MRHLLCVSLLTAITIVLPNSKAAPAPKRTDAKPAVIDAGTEKNIAGVLDNLAAGSGAQLRALFHKKKLIKLEIVRQQKDPRAWLGKNLRVERAEGKNLIRVSIPVGTPTEQAMIVNAVVDEYLEEVGRRRASLREFIQSSRQLIQGAVGVGKMTQKEAAEGEETLKKREEYVRSLPSLRERAKAP